MGKNLEGNSLLVKTFGNYPMIRVLDFLLENRTFNYSKSEIARHTKVSRTTLDILLEMLLKEKIILKTRTGGVIMYKLNLKSEVVKKLIELDFIISKRFIDKINWELKEGYTDFFLGCFMGMFLGISFYNFILSESFYSFILFISISILYIISHISYLSRKGERNE